MGERILNFTEYVENAISLYRDYCTGGRIRKCLIISRIVFELALISVHTIIRMDYYSHTLTEILYFYLTSGNSAMFLILALYHSRTYKSFICHLNFGYGLYTPDDSYKMTLEAKQSLFIALVGIVAISKIGLFSYSQCFPTALPTLPNFWHYLLELNLLMCDFRFTFEYLMLYCILFVMSEQIKFITRSIEGDTSILDSEILYYYHSESCNDQRSIEEVHKWSIGYRHVIHSCKLFNIIFGFQLTVMLTSAILFYIISMYTATSQSVAGHFTALDISAYMASLFLMLSTLFMLSRSAQQMQNSADVLRRRLCRLLIFSLSNKENYKATKDLLRLVSTQPIRARAFGSVNVDMALLPTCISFFTTYTVIALQFNNVL